MSSEEITSQAEVVESAESSVSSETEISSEVSVPEYPDRTKVPYEYKIINKSCDLNFQTYNKMVINSVEDFEKLKRTAENSYYTPSNDDYNSIKEEYDETFFENKSLILYIYSASEPHLKIEVLSVTKKDTTIYIDSVNYQRKLEEGEAIPYGIVNGLLSIEISKSYLENIQNININAIQKTVDA